MMLPDIVIKRTIRIELLKLSILSFIIISGGIILGVLIPMFEILNWTDFIFYSVIGFLLIVYQTTSFFIKTRKLNQVMEIDVDSELSDEVPMTKSDSTPNRHLKGSLLVDENAISFCPRCGSSFTKTYRFCPYCGFCGIIKRLK